MSTRAFLAGLVLGVLVAWAGPALANFVAEGGLNSVSITSSSGLSGDGTSDSPLACTAASASAAGCVSTSAQTFAGNKTVLGAAGQTGTTALFAVGNPDGGQSLLSTMAGGGTLLQTSTDTTPTTAAAWDTRHTVVAGVGGTAGSGLACSYNQTSNISQCMSLSPGVAWRELDFRTSSMNFYVGSGATSALAISSAGVVSAGLGVNINQGTGDALVVGTGYLRMNVSAAGAPTGTDCDAAGELGRLFIDTTNNRFYWCNGTAWQYVNEDVP